MTDEAQTKQNMQEASRELREEMERERIARVRGESPLFNLTELGNSERFIRDHSEDVRYCYPLKTWIVWDTSRWIKDPGAYIQEQAKRTVRKLYTEASTRQTDEERKAYAKWAIQSEDEHRIRGMLNLARSSVPVEPDELDQNPKLLNTGNYTIELKTLTPRPARREDLITKVTGAMYDPLASCDLWHDHLALIFSGDLEMVGFFRRVCGYALLGDNPDQVFFILWGSGKNGKSTTLTVLQKVLGEYCVNCDPSTLMIKRGEAVRSDVARLAGARVITSMEPEVGQRLAESLIKQLTGGDRLTARALYQSEFEFTSGGKIFLGTNHKPRVFGTDEAIWRRIILIPFTVQIPEEKRDRHIIEKLTGEASGILTWMLEGVREYNRVGLEIPERVRDAIKTYRKSEDLIGDYLEARCVLGNEGKVTLKNLYNDYKEDCSNREIDPITKPLFVRLLEERGCSKHNGTGNVLELVGIRFKDQQELETYQ